MVVWVYSGLTSRCVTLLQAYYLQRMIGSRQRLLIIWPIDGSCNINYKNVFGEQFKDIKYKVIQLKTEGKISISKCIREKEFVKVLLEVIKRIRIKRDVFIIEYFKRKYPYIDYEPPREIGWTGERYLAHLNDCWKEVRQCLEEGKEPFIHAYCGLIEGESTDQVDYSVICFADKWVQKAGDILGEHEKWIGVHIRRTDHKAAIAHSSVHAFCLKMDEILIQDNDVFFFLATDDEEVEHNLKDRYGNRVVTQGDKSWGRNSEDGMGSAIIDLLCLSECDTILGSYGSVFSNFASQYKHKKLIICGETDSQAVQ